MALQLFAILWWECILEPENLRQAVKERILQALSII